MSLEVTCRVHQKTSVGFMAGDKIVVSVSVCARMCLGDNSLTHGSKYSFFFCPPLWKSM